MRLITNLHLPCLLRGGDDGGGDGGGDGGAKGCGGGGDPHYCSFRC